MSRMGRTPGFSLIEMMICIALFAIVLPVAFHCLNSFQWFSHEENYKYALFQARIQGAELMKAPFDSLPPDTRTVPADGRVSLSQATAIPGSLKVYIDHKEVSPYYYQLKEGELLFSTSLKGAKALIEYDYLLPDAQEAATVPLKPPCLVTLQNTPVQRVLGVWRAEGGNLALVPAALYRVDYRAGTIVFDKALAGKVVEFSYLGGNLSTRASICYIDDNLKPVAAPGELKKITIEEIYGQKANNFSITMLRGKERQ